MQQVDDEKCGDQNADQAQAVEQMNSELTKIRVETRTKEADEVIKKAVELGKYCPAEKFIELKRKEYIENPDKVLKELELIPELKGKETQQSAISIDIKELNLTDEQRADIKELGYDLSDPKVKELVRKAYIDKEE